MPDFVSEVDLEEHKVERQKQWELVRKPDDPKERPEKIQPNLPVWKQLMHNKEERKESEQEAFAFKNNVFRTPIDADECDFYQSVAENKHKTMAVQDKAVQDMLKQGSKARVDTFKRDMANVESGKVTSFLENKFDVAPSKQKRKLASIVKTRVPVKSKKPALLAYSSSSESDSD